MGWKPDRGRFERRLTMLGIILCGVATVASSETIQQVFQTIPNPAFVLHNHNGTISVKGWDQSRVEIRGQRASDAMDVLIEGTDEKVTVKTHPRRQNLSRQEARVDLEIRLPRLALVSVDSEQGTVTVEDLERGVTVEGVTSSITLSRIQGVVTARTLDGPIVIRSSEGHIEAASVSGDLTFVQVNASKFSATTNSGTIRYQGDFGLGGTYRLHSYASPIEIQASPRASFEVEARSIQGSIDSLLPLPSPPQTASVRSARPGKSLQGRVGTGKSTVQITSYSGTIRLSGAR
ncbi:MAG: DUF4097 family beta strand repeat-containing protein [Terriglobia bacterium]